MIDGLVSPLHPHSFANHNHTDKHTHTTKQILIHSIIQSALQHCHKNQHDHFKLIGKE